MIRKTRQGFTLIELLIVIGIIAILAASLLIAGRGSTENGRAAKCATNLRNLAAASISYSVGNEGKFPKARTGFKASASLGGETTFQMQKGWISALDKDGESASSGKATECSFASSNPDDVTYALTNGALWSVVGGNRSTYMCPSFLKACRDAGTRDPGWSYQMNILVSEKELFNLSRADRTLLFAEIPCLDLNKAAKVGSKGQGGAAPRQLPAVNLTGDSGTPECDGCLQCKSAGGNESIGFNHIGTRRIFGHVAFADGHVEQLTAPKNGNFDDLTDWLCRGYDVTYEGGDYKEIRDSVEERDKQDE